MIKLPAYIFLTLFLFLQCCTNSGRDAKEVDTTEPLGQDNMAYKWGKISLECTANDTENFKPRPTVTSRILALIWVSVFDAWSRYDDKGNSFIFNFG